MPWLRAKAQRIGRRLPHVEWPLVALAGAGVLSVSAIGLVMALQLRDAGTKHELRRAEHDAQLAAAVIAPFVTAAVVDGDRAAVARLDRAVRMRLLHEPVVRVKVWTPDGRVVYSDEARLIGKAFDLADDEKALVGAGDASSELSDLTRPENRFERSEGQLLEVYTRMPGPGRSAMLVETYERYEPIVATSRALWLAMLPALLTGLLLLELTNLGIARWAVGRIRRADRQRAMLLERALDATNRERRRIAADLHDGVVQDLTAASITVDGASRTLAREGREDGTTSALQAATTTMRESVSALRTLLMDFYPADLESRGLAAALADLVALARSRGLDGRIEVAADMGAPHETEGLLYRVAQEALRNAVAHAQATVVTVRAGTDRGLHWLEVCDDGGGFDPRQSPSEGHIGLRALDGLLRDAGGRLEVESDPAEGTVVRALVPVGVTGAEDSAPLLG